MANQDIRSTRSIPAPAGEPEPGTFSDDEQSVYPRACGGTSACWPPMDPETGLSPRLRGNHVAVLGDVLRHRSIPAPAGEPRSTSTRSPLQAVYPRACGGTGQPQAELWYDGGLSPRLRGNLLHAPNILPRIRSIPAPAGEPSTSLGTPPPRQVYPRACGGTAPYLYRHPVK